MRQVTSIVTYTALAICAQTPLTAGLVENSPFVPRQQSKSSTQEPAPVIAAGSSNKYALKGIMSLAGTYHFSILDQESQKSRWLNLDQQFEGLSLLSYDEASKQLLVRYQNRTIRLPLSLENNISIALISGGQPGGIPPLKAPAISRRPNAFTATNFNANISKGSEASENALTSRAISVSTGFGGSASNRQIGDLPTSPGNTPPLQQTDNGDSENGSTSTSGFSNRFGIDQSRTSYVAPPPEEEDED